MPVTFAMSRNRSFYANGRTGWKADISGTTGFAVSEREFLVVYDYGMGGVWGFARAQSEAEICRTFPELSIVHGNPAWMTQEQERRVRSVSSFKVAEPSSYPEWLQTLVAQRGAS